MPSPEIPIQVPAETRQGTEAHWDTVMPGSEGFSRSYRGRGRKDVPTYGQAPKGSMLGNEALDE